MPAAAVTPAPIAYIKVVAVKKLVVEILIVAVSLTTVSARCAVVMFRWNVCGIELSCMGRRSFTVKKLECSKQAYAVEYISME